MYVLTGDRSPPLRRVRRNAMSNEAAKFSGNTLNYQVWMGWVCLPAFQAVAVEPLHGHGRPAFTSTTSRAYDCDDPPGPSYILELLEVQRRRCIRQGQRLLNGCRISVCACFGGRTSCQGTSAFRQDQQRPTGQ